MILKRPTNLNYYGGRHANWITSLGARDLLMKTHNTFYENQCITHKTESQLAEYTLKKIETYGFNFFLFRLIPRFGSISTHSKIITNYPHGFMELYEKATSYKKTLLLFTANSLSHPLFGMKSCFVTHPKFGPAIKRTV